MLPDMRTCYVRSVVRKMVETSIGIAEVLFGVWLCRVASSKEAGLRRSTVKCLGCLIVRYRISAMYCGGICRLVEPYASGIPWDSFCSPLLCNQMWRRNLHYHDLFNCLDPHDNHRWASIIKATINSSVLLSSTKS